MLPRFSELPVRPGAPSGSSWGVFGDDDEIGTLNFAGTALDDYIDDLFPQSSSQWDGLRHFADPEYGFYNRARLADLTEDGSGRLGMQNWARRGIAGRGVLLDVARELAADGRAPDPFDFFPIGPELLADTAERQGVELQPGDILLVRTGWLEAYERLDVRARERLAEFGRPGAPGLHGDDVPAFLWDNRIAAIAADNPALEATRPGDTSTLSLHVALIARLGMPLGELWRLEPLAADCAADGVYESLLVAAPLNVLGGVGSPANTLALK